MKCPDCGYKVRVRDKFCGMCGAHLRLRCPSCGMENPSAHRFCRECGSTLATGTTFGVMPLRAQEIPANIPESAPEHTLSAASEHIHSAAPERAPSGDQGASNLTQLEGERRLATIILADVKGSTDLLEQVGTEAWVKMMNRVLQILETEVYRFGGKVDQFRGDGLVAFFGTTMAHEDDPERAVLAALAMQTALQPFAADLEKREGIDLELRVGVNTGEVIVTSVGNDRQYREETAMGEAIALAARMETAAEPGTVLVSENTYRLTTTQFEWLPLGEIKVKGVSTPVAVYRPLTPYASPERPEAYELPSPLIGRDAEAESLKTCIEDLSDGIGGIVILTGEHGMGKSLLTDEVRQYFARQNVLLAEARDKGAEVDLPTSISQPTYSSPSADAEIGVIWLRGRCRSYTQSQPYAVWLDMLRNWLGIRSDEPQEKTRDRLHEQAEMLWGDQADEYYPDLATLLSLPLEADHAEQIKQLDADSLRQQFFLTLRSWVEALTQQGPLVINLSDMQWVDATSLDLLKYCLPLCDYTDLLWLFVFRPDRTSQIWEFRYYIETEYPHRLTNLTLAPLTVEQSQEMITKLIGPDVLPETMQDLIISKAEGNPYYIQELVRALIFEGILTRTPEDGRWRTTQAVTTLTLPDSMQNLLLASIDRLTPEEQHILQIASVVGTVFWLKIIEVLAAHPARVKAHLTALQRAQLIRERGRAPELGIEYVFRSSLIRDAAYDRLLSTQRTSYHLRIAEYVESHCCKMDATAQPSPQYYGALAYHFRHAGLPDKELDYVLKGAAHAKHVYANAEAGKQYTRALEILDALEHEASDEDQRRAIRIQRFRVLNERRAVFYLMGQFEAMWEDARALLPLADKLADDPTLTIDALLQQPGVADYQSKEEIEAGIPMAQQALALAQQLGDRRREMESLIAIVNHRLALSDPTWQPLAEQALDLARQLQDEHYEARLLIGMGGVFAFSDEPALSMEYLEAAAAFAMRRGLDDKITQMSLLNLLGLEFERSGDYYRLLTEYQQERLNISREIGHRPNESKALQACGRIRGIYLGDYQGGLGLLEECRRILVGSRDEVYPLFHIAQIQSEQYQYTEALASLDRIRAIGEPLQDRGLASLKLVWAILYNALGDEAHLHMALELAEEVQQNALQSPLVSRQYEMAALCKATAAHLKLALLAKDATTKLGTIYDHLNSALDAAQKALDLYQTFGFVQITECVSEEILFRYSQALTANERPEEATKYLRRAYDEMARKHALIPADSYFRRTYLENILLHQEIRAAYAARVGLILTESGQVPHLSHIPEEF